MEDKARIPKESLQKYTQEKNVSDFLENFVIFLSPNLLSQKINRKTPNKYEGKVAQIEEPMKPQNENPNIEFPVLTPLTQKHLDFNKKTIYDFDLYEMDGQCLIASVVDNSYYLHCFDMKKNSMDLIKQEKVELTVSDAKDNFNEEDSFYNIRFAEYYPNEEKNDIKLFLVFAGKSGIIFLVNIEKNFELSYLLGHVNEVYDTCAPNTRKEPEWKNLLFSCSKDTSVNLWNIRTKVQIACFREITQVPADSISLHCHHSMEKFAVSHFDGCIKVWYIDENVVQKINEARKWKGDPFMFKHLDVRKPHTLTRDLHYNTCDYVQYYGDFLVSKDSEGIICFSSLTKLGAQIIYEISYHYYEPIWFVKCGLDLKRKLLFVGNDNGEVFFWKLNQDAATEYGKINLPVKKQVRKAVLTSDARYLILTIDEGGLWYLQFHDAF